MAPFGGNRFPARVRVAVAGAALLAVAAGVVAAVLPDDGSSGRTYRPRHNAGSTGVAGGTDSADGAPSDSTTPPAPGDEAAAPAVGGPATGPTGTGAPTTAGGAGTTTATPGSGPGSSTSTNSRGGPATAPAPGSSAPGTTPTTAPTGATRPGAPATATPGWDLLPKAPIGPRTGHTAVWTGREMVVWGGSADYDADPALDGAAYDPAARTWRRLPAAPLAPRFDPRAWWTGQQMLVFGGTSVDGDFLTDGALWDPATNQWRAIPASPLGARDGAVVEWAGDRLVIWSGNTVAPPDAGDFAAEPKNDGSAYVPATNRWVPVGPAPIPPRSGAQSAWTGSRLIVTGGDDDHTDGAALDPLTGAWSPIAARPESGSCGGDSACTGLWTGTKVLFAASSAAYDPAADRWSAMAEPPGSAAPTPGEPAVWTGRGLLAWGVPGDDPDDTDAGPVDTDDTPPVNAGAVYDPVADRWQPLSAGPLSARAFHTAVWTGDTLLIWGGVADDEPQADGAAYRPE